MESRLMKHNTIKQKICDTANDDGYDDDRYERHGETRSMK